MKRWWSIRHIRFCWHTYWCHRHTQMWGEAGLGLGYPHEADLAALDAIWRGDW